MIDYNYKLYSVLQWRCLLFLFSIITCVVVEGGGAHVLAQSSEIRKQSGRAPVVSSSQKTIREGREMIEMQNWGGATECFNSFITANPKDKNIDAAIFWLAYSLMKRGEFYKADRELIRLIDQFPSSSWSDDARVMRVEIAGALGNKIAIGKALEDKDENIRLVALQSIFETDTSAGAIMAIDLLRSTTSSSYLFKDAIVNMLGHYRSTESDSLLEKIALDNATENRLRGGAIYWISKMNSDQSIVQLIRIYDSMETESLKYYILTQLGSINRKSAIQKLFDVGKSEQSMQLRSYAAHLLEKSQDPEAKELLNKIRN